MWPGRNAMLAVWLVDVGWQWIVKTPSQKRSPLAAWGLHLFFGFTWINATVVFGQGIVRGAGVSSGIFLLMIFGIRRFARLPNLT